MLRATLTTIAHSQEQITAILGDDVPYSVHQSASTGLWIVDVSFTHLSIVRQRLADAGLLVTREP